jgi:hypothetical protein
VTTLHIHPDAPQAKDAIVTVLDMLQEGDDFELHVGISSPWMRVVARDTEGVVAAMRASGVRVEVRGG